jgi:predicted transcriptional regulator of viral defense system
MACHFLSDGQNPIHLFANAYYFVQLMNHSFELAIQVFKANKGILRTKEALKTGIHQRTLYAMKKEGLIVCISRGFYRLADLPPLQNPDLATVAKRIPQGVVCLVSALAFHGLTTQIPHEISMAIPRSAWFPHLDYPPLKIHRFGNASLDAGVETHAIDGIDVRVYSPEKTLADCFKFRNKIGLPVFLEALRAYRRRRKPDFDKVLEYARVCRVERLIKPHLETIL